MGQRLSVLPTHLLQEVGTLRLPTKPTPRLRGRSAKSWFVGLRFVWRRQRSKATVLPHPRLGCGATCAAAAASSSTTLRRSIQRGNRLQHSLGRLRDGGKREGRNRHCRPSVRRSLARHHPLGSSVVAYRTSVVHRPPTVRATVRPCGADCEEKSASHLRLRCRRRRLKKSTHASVTRRRRRLRRRCRRHVGPHLSRCRNNGGARGRPGERKEERCCWAKRT